jgi:hypothetical protein
MREYWLDPVEHSNPICPVCGEECETIYKANGDVIGCDQCVISVDAYDWADQQEIDDESAYGDYLCDMRREERYING